MIKAIIFDVFGVLITDALEAMLVDFRAKEPEKAAQIVDTIRAANKGLIPIEVSRATVAKLLGITVAEYTHQIQTGEAKNQTLFEYIKQLRPRYKIGVLSNVSDQGLNVRFTPEEQQTYFDAMVASGAIGHAKPELLAYQITAEQLGVSPDECIMIDDRESACQGAQEAGMQAILYTSFEQMKTDLEKLLEQAL